MTTSAQQRSVPRSTRAIATAAVSDALLILVFAAIGRDAHARPDVISGVFLTAWPFLAGAALGWLAARAWRRPLGLPAGVAIWLVAVGGGMALRAITGQTVVLPFVIVALLSLGLFLVGYRALLMLVRRLRRS
jgi:peptidoglycan/LPS O-acetylase OafA/YrhL